MPQPLSGRHFLERAAADAGASARDQALPLVSGSHVRRWGSGGGAAVTVHFRQLQVPGRMVDSYRNDVLESLSRLGRSQSMVQGGGHLQSE